MEKIVLSDWQKELADNFKRHGVFPVAGAFGIDSVRGGKYHPLRCGECCVVGAALIGHECRSEDKLADFAHDFVRTKMYVVGLVAGFDLGSCSSNTSDDDYAVGFRDGVAVRGRFPEAGLRPG